MLILSSIYTIRFQDFLKEMFFIEIKFVLKNVLNHLCLGGVPRP